MTISEIDNGLAALKQEAHIEAIKQLQEKLLERLGRDQLSETNELHRKYEQLCAQIAKR